MTRLAAVARPFTSLFAAPARRRHSDSSPAAAAVESLEDRVVLTSIGVSASVLYIEGSGYADKIELWYSHNNTAVQARVITGGRVAMHKAYWLRDVKFVNVQAWGGNDMVNNFTYIPDRLAGGWGDDTLYGGFCDSILVGEKNNDTLYGRGGKDTLWGQEGTDKLYGGVGEDWLLGGSEGDHLFGEGGNDLLEGMEGNDYLNGGADNDWLYGGIGTDILYGGQGRDTINGDQGVDSLFAGDGNDVFEETLGNRYYY